jgi:hypothetical protein
MARKPKFEEEAKTKPRGRQRIVSGPPETHGAAALAAKRKAAEAPTEPPPKPEEDVEVRLPKNPKVSGMRPRKQARAANVDEVTEDLTKDPRREDD